jgi:hypothetical protein
MPAARQSFGPKMISPQKWVESYVPFFRGIGIPSKFLQFLLYFYYFLAGLGRSITKNVVSLSKHISLKF